MSTALLLLAFASFGLAAQTPAKPNVLYLMADDMRPNIGAYGLSFMQTPHLDKLANEGMLFSNAYTQYAVCGPSRNSFLSGRRPDTIKCWNFKNHFRQVGPDYTALPQYFKEAGYFTSAAGKIYHANLPPDFDGNKSWTVVEEDVIPWATCPGNNTTATEGVNNPNYCNPAPADPPFDEETIINHGFALLDEALATEKPWFIGIGTHRPHWPWRAPPEFLALYPDEVPVASDKLNPVDVPPMACQYQGNMQEPNWHCADCIVPDPHAQQYRRHYYAACSYADSIVGRAVAAVEKVNQTNRTIVIFHADHGYQLGEHNQWEKFTNFELGTRVPLIIKVPWKLAVRGRKSTVMAELVDMYRTLAALSGFPNGPVEDGVEGQSLAPLFDAPAATTTTTTTTTTAGGEALRELDAKVALSQFARCGCKNTTNKHTGKAHMACGHCVAVPRGEFQYMGYSLRSPKGWRYTEWMAWNGTALDADWADPAGLRGVELYDHRGDNGTDFGGYENVNLAHDPSYTQVAAELHAELRVAFKAPP